jgi:hypothetical protein
MMAQAITKAFLIAMIGWTVLSKGPQSFYGGGVHEGMMKVILNQISSGHLRSAVRGHALPAIAMSPSARP